MNIYELLDKKKKKRRSFLKTEDYIFFMSNKHLLSKFPRFSYFIETNNDFDVFRANIILRGYLNKSIIEKEVFSLEEKYGVSSPIDNDKLKKTIKEKMIDAPYYVDEYKDKIFIPFFSRSLNKMFIKEPYKLLVPPYSNLKEDFVDSIIDPFDTYGAMLYNSLYTSLLFISSNDTEYAFFHYDTNTIYIVNKQGRLDNKLVLFDKYIRHPSYNHMIERIKPVVEAYFINDRSQMINALFQNGFISNKCLSLINKYMKKRI